MAYKKSRYRLQNRKLNSEILALNDAGAIKGLDVQEGDGVYITYQDGADTVRKKLGSVDFTLTFSLACEAVVNVNGTVITPSASGTVTVKCENGVITSTSGTSISGGMSGTPHSNVARASVSNFRLT